MAGCPAESAETRPRVRNHNPFQNSWWVRRVSVYLIRRTTNTVARHMHERIRLHAHILTYIIVSPLHAHQRNSSDRKMDGARGGYEWLATRRIFVKVWERKRTLGQRSGGERREREATISSLRFLPSTATATIRTCAPNPLQLGIFLSLRLFAVKKRKGSTHRSGFVWV